MKKSLDIIYPCLRPTISQPSILLALDWFDERLYRGIFTYAKEKGWHMSPYMISDRSIPRGWPGDGAITCCGPNLRDFIEQLQMPTVDISIEAMKRQVPRVVVDNAMIGEIAADHFHSRGYTHYAYYSWAEVTVNHMRRDSYFSALRKRGVPAANQYEILQTPMENLGDWEAHQRDIFSKLNELPRPLAVFAGQDNLGATLIDICVRNGVHIPEEVSVLGVDNIELLCEAAAVPLSSIRTNLTELGYRAAQQLDRLMAGEIDSTAEMVCVPPVGVVRRQSSDVLAVAHPAVASAIRFIRENYDKPITIEDISAFTGLSKRGLEKAFRKHLNRSPALELRRLRLQHAKRMLTETAEKVDYIASSCGYSNNSNLSCAFKKDTGLSPREYRSRYKAKHLP